MAVALLVPHGANEFLLTLAASCSCRSATFSTCVLQRAERTASQTRGCAGILSAMSRAMTKSIILNGAPHRSAAATIAELVRELDLAPEKVAVERNGAIVPRSTLAEAPLAEGDTLEIVHFVGGGDHTGKDTWTVAGRTFRSRLIVGTGKYKSFEQNAAAVEASGAEIVTVAVRRVNVSDPKAPMLTDFIDPRKITYLPNTAGCFTGEEAVRTLRLAREAGGWDLVKLEVLGEARTLYPDMRETLKATEVLAREGFHPMVYCADDPIAAKQLEDAARWRSCRWAPPSVRGSASRTASPSA